MAYKHAHSGGIYPQPYSLLLADVGKHLRFDAHKREHLLEEGGGLVILGSFKGIVYLGLFHRAVAAHALTPRLVLITLRLHGGGFNAVIVYIGFVVVPSFGPRPPILTRGALAPVLAAAAIPVVGGAFPLPAAAARAHPVSVGKVVGYNYLLGLPFYKPYYCRLRAYAQ